MRKHDEVETLRANVKDVWISGEMKASIIQNSSKLRKIMYYVYILTNKTNEVMYVGITNDLKRRICEHINEEKQGFTSKYHVHKLVYFERFVHPDTAISREKQLKGWARQKKNKLVELQNPLWEDLLLKI